MNNANIDSILHTTCHLLKFTNNVFTFKVGRLLPANLNVCGSHPTKANLLYFRAEVIWFHWLWAPMISTEVEAVTQFLFINLFIHSFIYSFIDSFIHWFAHLLIHLFIHWFIRAFHSFIHKHTRERTCQSTLNCRSLCTYTYLCIYTQSIMRTINYTAFIVIDYRQSKVLQREIEKQRRAADNERSQTVYQDHRRHQACNQLSKELARHSDNTFSEQRHIDAKM